MSARASRLLLGFLLAATLAVCAATLTNRAEGAFPGLNGKIVYDSLRDGNYDVWVMNPDGTDNVNISNNPAYDAQPGWSADGTQIVFVSDRDGNREIYKMDATGGNVVRLTNNSLRDHYPAWTSDGRIVFERTPGPAQCISTQGEIYIMNADGSGQQNLTNNSSTDCYPAGSSTAKVAFTTGRDGADEIYTMNLDGSGVMRITNNSWHDDWPNWSPDGQRIVVIRYSADGLTSDIYVINADGSGEMQLTNTPSRIEFKPAWSPQGDKIVLRRARSVSDPHDGCNGRKRDPADDGRIEQQA